MHEPRETINRVNLHAWTQGIDEQSTFACINTKERWTGSICMYEHKETINRVSLYVWTQWNGEQSKKNNMFSWTHKIEYSCILLMKN